MDQISAHSEAYQEQEHSEHCQPLSANGLFQHPEEESDNNNGHIMRLVGTPVDQSCSYRLSDSMKLPTTPDRAQDHRIRNPFSKIDCFGDHGFDRSHGLRAHLRDTSIDGKFTMGCSRSYPKSNSGILLSSNAARTRWKPNAVQLTILEEHFNSGYSRATPELHAAVQGAGLATESQVTVWLKNRLSRCKRPPTMAKEQEVLKEEESSDNEKDSDQSKSSTGNFISVCGGSELLNLIVYDLQQPWEDFQDLSQSIISQLASSVSTVAQTDLMLLSKSITCAARICCYGVGREGLVLQGLASRLHHLGFSCYCIGDTNLPQIGPMDLMITTAGSTCNSSVHALVSQAARLGAKVICFAPPEASKLPFANHIISVPTFCPWLTDISGKETGSERNNSASSHQNSLSLSSSYEMSLWLALECVCIVLQKLGQVSAADMRAKHTNLE